MSLKKTWERLETYSRHSDFSQGLKATIHDPAWMLARQWQLGEFEGEDVSSPASIELVTREGEISKISLGQSNMAEYDDDDDNNNYFNIHIPLEVYVEKTKLEIPLWKTKPNSNDSFLDYRLDLKTRVRLGLQFQREMKILLKDVLPSNIIKHFKRHLALGKDSSTLPDLSFNELTHEELLDYELSVTKDYLKIINGRVIDISKIYYDSKFAPHANTILVSKAREYFSNDISLANSVGNALINAYESLKNWWNGGGEDEEAFFEKLDNGEISAWTPRHLEYNFNVQIGSSINNTNNNLILDANEYKEDHLDWYSFTVGNDNSPILKTRDITIVPSNLKFPGMPDRRWWNFEDSHVDFGSVDPKINNLATSLLMDFVLVHSSDWYIIPFEMQVGTINQIESLTIIDTFGDAIVIEPAGHTKEELKIIDKFKSWNSWSMFNISKKYEKTEEQRYTPYFFMPPTIDTESINNVNSSEPIEEVTFLRDEIDNLVWAIEKKYRTFYGEPISGNEHYLWQQKKIEENSLSTGSDRSTSDSTTNYLKYIMMTGDPWNWIPFIPIHANELLLSSSEIERRRRSRGWLIDNNDTKSMSYKQIMLQRVIMPEIINGNLIHIYPHSRILNEPPSPYYIDESEIPRSGIILWEKYYRIVRSDGRISLWKTRKRSLGSREGRGGLKFDYLPLRKKI